MENSWIILLVSLIILLYVTITLSLKTGLIKDVSSATKKPYSLARSQVAFWTVIIASSYIFLLYKADFIFSNVVLSDTVFILLGVSVTTATGGSMVDAADKEKQNSEKPIIRHQDSESDGFWKDILSDANGYSISRYQNVIFTIILGVGFIISAVSLTKVGGRYVMIDLDSNLLILSGVSAAGYLGVKRQENE